MTTPMTTTELFGLTEGQEVKECFEHGGWIYMETAPGEEAQGNRVDWATAPGEGGQGSRVCMVTAP